MTDNEISEVLIDRFDEVGCTHCGTMLNVSQLEPFTPIECPSCKKQLRVPAQIGNFVLLDVLGQGGMGSVFKGFDATLKRTVAIKVMKKSYGEDQEFIAQFLREARALAALNHPNVVMIYNYGEEKGQPYIVMEMVDGGRMDQMIRKQGHLDEKQLLRTALDVVHGMRAAAGIGLSHGDMKPANILYDREGKAKVVDFGLARFRGEKMRPGEIWGTPFYVAPEVVRGKQPDQKADIYSLGGTLFHALTGHPPFNKETVQDTVLARFKEPVPDILAIRSDVHPKTAAVIKRMLELDPFMRYPNYDSLLNDLQDAQQDLDPAFVAAHAGKKSPALAIALVVAGLAVVVGLALFFTLGRKKPEPEPEKKAVIRRMVDGKIVTLDAETFQPVSTNAGESGAVMEKPAMVEINSSVGKGADVFINGSPKAKGADNIDFLWVKAGKDAGVDLARKAYLKFDLTQIKTEGITNASLTLATAATAANEKIREYKMMLWGLNKKILGANWSESLGSVNWFNAPGNNPQSATGMSADAELLATIAVDPALKAGELIHFTNTDSVKPNAFLDFLRQSSGEEVTLVVTADDACEQKTGWKFASKENAGFKPPTLTLDPAIRTK